MTNLPPPPPGFNSSRSEKKEENLQPLTLNEQVAKIFRETLTARHQHDKVVLGFIMSFVDCRHVGQASKSVGITAVEGRNLMKYKDVSEAVAKIAGLTAEKYGFAAEDLVKRVEEIAQFDPGCVYNADGTFKHLKDLSPDERRAIRSFECRNIMEKDPNGMETGRMIGQIMKYEFYDRIDAVKLGGREKDIFKERKVVTHDITATMNQKLLAGLQRASEARMIAERDVTDTGEGEE